MNLKAALLELPVFLCWCQHEPDGERNSAKCVAD